MKATAKPTHPGKKTWPNWIVIDENGVNITARAGDKFMQDWPKYGYITDEFTAHNLAAEWNKQAACDAVDTVSAPS